VYIFRITYQNILWYIYLKSILNSFQWNLKNNLQLCHINICRQVFKTYGNFHKEKVELRSFIEILMYIYTLHRTTCTEWNKHQVTIKWFTFGICAHTNYLSSNQDSQQSPEQHHIYASNHPLYEPAQEDKPNLGNVWTCCDKHWCNQKLQWCARKHSHMPH